MRPSGLLVVGVVVGAFLIPGAAAAQTAVAKSDAPAAAFSARAANGTTFTPLPEKADIGDGVLLVALPGATLRGANGAVELTSRADFDGRSPFPILETAVAVHRNAAVDLDFTLDRGRVDLTNRKADGPAAVDVRFQGRKWSLTLEKPGTRVAIEIYGRWQPGMPFRKDAGPDHAPTVGVVAVALSGTAQLSNGETTTALRAPPGPAQVAWSNTQGNTLGARRLDRLPEWATDAIDAGPRAAEGKAAVEKYRRLLAEQPGTAADAMLASTAAADQRVALVALGATDDLDRLAKAITETNSAEVWDFGMAVVRHWIGRGPGQDDKLFAFLLARRNYTPAQAGTLLRLLHGFGDDDARRPETYEVLIEYLLHDKPAVRNLAAWNLVRLAPAGKAIPFRPAAGKDEYQAVYTQWKALIPPGRLPPAAKK